MGRSDVAAPAMTQKAATLIDGKAIAARLRQKIAAEIQASVPARGRPPCLHVILVGDNAASSVYVKAKDKAAREAGFVARTHLLPATTPQEELLARLAALNADETVDGILVQLPLPPAMDAQAVLAAIAPEKDVDGFHVTNAGRLAVGMPALTPCTPMGCLILLKETLGESLAGLHAVVLGRSNIVGKPMGQLLLAADCTVTIAHSKTRDLPALCRTADILVAAIGRPEMVQGDWIKEGATIIDVGINRLPTSDGKGRLVGDVDFAAAQAKAGAITPVPGGVGPMTIACLLQNTLFAYTHSSTPKSGSGDRAKGRDT